MAYLRRISLETWIVGALALALFGALVFLKIVLIGPMRGDTAIFVQLTQNIAATGHPVSQVFASTQGFLDGHYPVMKAAEIAKNPLLPPVPAERNMLDFHLYLVLFVLGLFAKVVSAWFVVYAAMTASFLALAVLAYASLRRGGANVVVAGLFAMLVMAYPAWWEGLVYGQFYPDVLFVGIGLAFALAFAGDGIKRAPLAVLAVSCAIINERAAITAGIFGIVWCALNWKTIADRKFRVGTAIALLLYGTIAIKLFLVNSDYSGFMPSTQAQLMARLHNPAFDRMIGYFLVANLPLLALAAFRWRSGLTAFVLMIPNIVGTIGGAEKVQWSTHYHVFYFPFLVWAAVLGLARMNELLQDRAKAWGTYAALVACGCYIALLGPYTAGPFLTPAAIPQSFYFAFPKLITTYDSRAGLQYRNLAVQLSEAIPTGSVVTTVETGMPFLFEGRTIYDFPIGVDRANYAVVQDFVQPDNGHIYGGSVNFYGKAEAQAEDRVVVARMRKDGYDFEHPVVRIPGLGIAVIARR
ncbi:MAG: hypothetical protein KGN02_05150 [bacterium]|nr:hypothetical protein [bacterium]